MYISFDIPKKNGGVRKINAPKKFLKFIQRNLARALSIYKRDIYKNKKINNKLSHGFEEKKSFITNAKIHRNKLYVINFDLKDFFDCFHFGRVKGYFEKNIYFKLPKEIAIIIAQLTCYHGCLPQGAPTSPIITNLICNIFDVRVLNLAKKYKLDYTRYADDLTFSTNEKEFIKIYNNFYKELVEEIDKFGFKINEEKSRIQYNNSRQEVTGIVVNKKLNINREYYKKTRAMADSLYKTGRFFIDGKEGTINQLEGRFSLINQVVWYNNKILKEKEKHNKYIKKNVEIYKKSCTRERDYEKFLIYKYFVINKKPLLITEGKTDKLYIQAALKSLYKEYPELIIKNKNGNFEYKIDFFNRTKRINYFLDVNKTGADTLINICNYYFDKVKNGYENYIEDNEFNTSGKKNKKPVAKLFNNDRLSNKKDDIIKNRFLKIKENLYVMVIPLVNDKKNCEIEDLFKDDLLKQKIDNRTFDRKSNDNETCIGKDTFSKHVKANYRNIDFSNFRLLLDTIKNILNDYKNNK